MNKKGQMQVISVIFGLIGFIILWVMFLAGYLSELAQQLIVDQGLTGIEAFLVANINLWIGVGMVIGILGFIYFGGGQTN